MTFDLDRPRARANAEAYWSLPRPLFTRLPFDYRRVPPRVRTAALSVIDRLRPEGPGFPAWPIDRSLDRPIDPASGPRPPTPLLVTHDVDSRAELGLIEPLRAMERDLGVVSAWGFVPGSSWPAEELVRDLIAEGCEPYWHDLGHDGQLPWLGVDRIRAAFAAVDAGSPWAPTVMRTFRSGNLLMSRALMTVVEERFDIDLSIPDVERAGPYGRAAGCATVIPFRIGSCLEIPLSLPQDFFLRHVHGLSADEALAVWKHKVDHIVAVGGVAVLNTHPVWVQPRRRDMWNAYRSFLEWATARSDIQVATPGSVLRDCAVATGGIFT